MCETHYQQHEVSDMLQIYAGCGVFKYVNAFVATAIHQMTNAVYELSGTQSDF